MQIIYRPKPNLFILVVALLWPAIILFISIAAEVTERKPLPGDVATLEFIHRHVSTHWFHFFLIFTDLGSTLGIIILTTLLFVYLLYKQQRHSCVVLLCGVAGAAIANVIIKVFIRRQRPSLWHALVSEPGFSFPSGHAMASSALVFTLIFLTWQTRWRWLALGIGVPFFLLVSFSRLYFGVHYPSDIIGGWLASLVWVGLVGLVATTYAARLQHPSN